MASLLDQFTYSQNATLQSQVKQAMISSAIAVSGEAQAFNRNRVALAIKILAPGGLASYLSQFAQAVCNDATVSGTIASGGASSTATDANITNAVTGAWNAIANV